MEPLELQNPTTPTRTRKRRANPDEWKRNIRKRLRASGDRYLDRKGIERPKKVPNFTDCKCKFKCRDQITVAQQESLFNEYYSWKDSNRQKDFICSLVQEGPVARKRKRKDGSVIEKKISRQYFLPNGNGGKNRVCLPFFCNTFAFSKKTIINTVKFKSPSGKYRGKDKRKGKPAHNATPNIIVKAIKRFLSDIPKVPSHYCRSRSRRLYLAPDLSITKLFDLYCEKNPNKLVKEHVFRRVFAEYEPPLSIFCPKKDQCAVCNNAESTKTTETNEKYIAHRSRNKAIQEMKSNDKQYAKANPKSVIYATFDLQAVLTLPYAGDGKIYYSRKLSVLNFTIFDSKNKGTCFLWDETNGKKGSAEISTCLIRYLKSLPSEIESVVMYADTCGGQNRNRNIMTAMLYVVNTINTKLQTIDLKYMESGHSYLEADSIHATIEREKRHKNIYIPEEYKLIIQMSRKKPFPYDVNTINYNDIYDLQKLNNDVIKNVKKTTENKMLNWMLCKWFRFQRGSCQVAFKYDVNATHFEYLDVNTNGIDWNNVVLKKKYDAPIPITLSKKKDLLDLLKKGVIPQSYTSYYNNLPAGSLIGKKKIQDLPLWDDEFNENEEELDQSFDAV